MMPRFHFDLVEDGRAVPDDDGLDLLSVDVARGEAVKTAGEMMKDRTRQKAEPADLSIIVRDGGGTVCTVTVALKVE
jgi:hypothetical protein